MDESTLPQQTPEIPIPDPEQQEVPLEGQKQTAIQTVADDMRGMDSAIESSVRTVQQIFSVLERQGTERGNEVSQSGVTDSPEKIVEKMRADFSQLEHPSIDDIARVLTTSGLEMTDIQLWLAAHTSEIQALGREKEALNTQSSELSAQLIQEEQRNFFMRLFRRKERQRIATQSAQTADRIEQITTTLGEKQSRVSTIEAATQEFLKRQQELALVAVQEVFQSVVERYRALKKRLTTPEITEELNRDLLAEKVLPALDLLQAQGNSTREDADEYVGLLKLQLAEGSQAGWSDTAEKREILEARRRRLDELDSKSGYALKEISRQVRSEGAGPADRNYSMIFDFLLREIAKEQIEKICDTLDASASPTLQAKVTRIARGVIRPDFGEYGREVLDIRAVSMSDLKELSGLERWKVVKDFAVPAGMIPKEVFAQVERIIIQRLFDEQLSPGGRESWPGTEAVGKIGDLGSPEALPLLLRHIEATGSGHTNNAAVHTMEHLLKESDPAELQQVLESLPKSKRVLLETLADEDSYMSRFGRVNMRYYTCHLLQNGDWTIAREQLTRILEQRGTSDEEQLRGFYLGNTEDTPETLQFFLAERSEVERIIINSRLSVWSQSADKLLAALVNPRNGESVAFPKRILQEGLGITDEKLLAVLDRIFATKTFKESGFEREAFLDGLVLLNSKENGKMVLETLFSAYRGAKADPSRMRRIFQLLSTLDGLGEYGFVTPDQTAAIELQQAISEAHGQYQQTEDKPQKRKIKNKIEGLEKDLQNLTGLKGIEDVMMRRIAEVACRRLELPEEYQKKIEEHLEELLKSGLFDIIPALAGKYEGKGETAVKDLLRTITTHIIDGDFTSWRYAHEQSEAQLAGLTDTQKEFWKGTVEPVTIAIFLPEDEQGRRADELKAVQAIIGNAKAHILDSDPNFDFSRERIQLLEANVHELTEQIKFAASVEEKDRLVQEKRTVQAEVTLIRGILEIEQATPESFTIPRMVAQARELRERITELDLPLAGLDIEQIEKVFTVGDIQRVTAYESDDPLTLLKVGVEPQETCQSWRGGQFNECLLAYVADSNKKVVNVADEDGRILARSIIKLTDQRDEDDPESKTKRKTLLVEKPYSLLPNSEVYRAFIRVLLIKAQGLGASITLGKGFETEILEVFEEEARAYGYEMRAAKLDIYIPRSLNRYEYSDTLGGKITTFDRYQPLEGVTFEKIPT